MLDKIKMYAKNIQLYGIVILSFIVMFLFGKLKRTEDKLEEKTGESELKEVILKKEEAKNEANKSEDAYKLTRDEFIRKYGSDGSTD